MEWKVELRGHESDLQYLSDNLGEDPKVVDGVSGYVLQSTSFDGLEDYEAVFSEAQGVLNTILLLFFDTTFDPPLELGGVIREGDDGTRDIFVKAGKARTRVSAKAATVVTDVDIEEDSTPTYDEIVFELSKEDPVVSELASIGANGHSWVNLYRMFEFIQDNKPDGSLPELGWISKTDKDRFKRTANSRDVLGDEARHGNDRTGGGPANPMTHAEARSVVQKLINQFVKHRFKSRE